MLLAIDTSTRMVGIALYDGIRVNSEMVWLSHQYHTVELAPTVFALMERAGVSVSDLEVVAVALGPGSYTGLRIGLAFAKGIALASNLVIVGVPTLDILASAQPPGDISLAAVLQAGRGRLAVGWYRYRSKEWKPDGKVEILTAQMLADNIDSPTILCGELTAEERSLFWNKRKIVALASPAQSLRRPSSLAELGWRRWRRGNIDDPATLAPQYIHYGEPIPG